jgi:hypothetical protein
MNTDVEELLSDGMERFTAGVRAPAGLARTAGRLHRRRLAVRAAVTCGTAAVTVAAVVAVTGVASGGPVRPRAAGAQGRPAAAVGVPGLATGKLPRTGPSGTQARADAYVIRRVETALAGENLVFRGYTVGGGQSSITWAYGPRNRFEELFHGQPAIAVGTALIGGKLTGVYITYSARTWSLMPVTTPASACSITGALEMGGPPIATSHWSAFINASLACGAATVTGHVRIDGVETTKITGLPVTVKMSAGQAKSVGEKRARVRWALWVNRKTYLPVRMFGSTETFGGSASSTRFASVTDAQWLRPTPANIDKALVTIPAGFHQVSSPASQ